jgi:hypothetical protein
MCLVVSALAGALPVEAGLFKTTSPTLIYTGAGPGLDPGVLVIRDDQAYARAIEPLDPAFGGPPPKIDDVTVLRVVGRARENRCRDTALLEVSTKGTTATVQLEERVGDPKCACAPDAQPPKVFLVTVTRWVRHAQVVTKDQIVPCTVTKKDADAAPVKPALIFEGSWDGAPGSKVIIEPDEYRAALVRLGLRDRGPEVDFNKERVLALTGRSRENSCRQTKVADVRLAAPDEVVVELDEIYPGTGQACAQVFMQPRVFLYRVPASVTRARVITRELK